MRVMQRDDCRSRSEHDEEHDERASVLTDERDQRELARLGDDESEKRVCCERVESTKLHQHVE